MDVLTRLKVKEAGFDQIFHNNSFMHKIKFEWEEPEQLLNVCLIPCLSRDLYVVISELETLTDEKYGGIEIG